MDRVRIDRRWLPLNALRAFEAVAKHGSFTGAANALLISQSALSRHVISLERLIGVQLFDRKPHTLALTPAGQHLLPVVTKSFDRLEYALDEIRHAVLSRRPLFGAALLCLVRPAWAHSYGCKSRHELVTASEVKRNCMRATDCWEEAWIEAAGR